MKETFNGIKINIGCSIVRNVTRADRSINARSFGKFSLELYVFVILLLLQLSVHLEIHFDFCFTANSLQGNPVHAEKSYRTK